MMYQIRRAMFHKGYVLLLSIVHGAAFWSTNVYHGSNEIEMEGLSALFQDDHDKQINDLIKERIKNKDLDDKKYKEQTVEFIKPQLN